ncbi:hypothetical protein LCGC14_2700240, partial [marine sediment metagenome]
MKKNNMPKPKTISDFNKGFEGDIDITRPRISFSDPNFKRPKTISDFNFLFEKVEVPKGIGRRKRALGEPEKGPLIQFSSPELRPVEEGEGTPGTLRVVTPEVSSRGILSPVGDALNVVSYSTGEFANRLVDMYDFAIMNGIASEEDAKQFAAKTLRFGAATAGVMFTPISASLAAAERVPILKYPAKLTSFKIEKLGETGAWLLGKGLEGLPIEEGTKQIFRQPIQEIGQIAFPLIAAKGLPPGLKKLQRGKRTVERTVTTPEGETYTILGRSPTRTAAGAKIAGETASFMIDPLGKTAKIITNTIIAKVKERKRKGENVNDPNVAKKIVNEAVKEVPAEIPGAMEITKVDSKGNIKPGKRTRVYTNQKLVLQNFLKGREDI